MITLSNGATVIRCEIGYGRAGEQKFIGKVLAHYSTNDPFVAWHIASEDGITASGVTTVTTKPLVIKLTTVSLSATGQPL